MIFEDREQRAARTAITRTSFFADLAVTEKIACRDEFVGEFHGLVIVRIVVVAVRKVERIDVPITRMETLFNDLKCKFVSRRDHRSARLSLREELLFAHFL